MRNDRTYCFKPSVELPKGYIKGTVGAGDAFCAGMLYSIYMGWKPDYALEIANTSAACSLAEANATDGMKNIKEIRKLAKNMRKRKDIFKEHGFFLLTEEGE